MFVFFFNLHSFSFELKRNENRARHNSTADFSFLSLCLLLIMTLIKTILKTMQSSEVQRMKKKKLLYKSKQFLKKPKAKHLSDKRA